MKDQKALLYDLAADPSLREQFCSTPEQVLREYGYDPDQLDLPKTLAPDQIKGNLDRILVGDFPEAGELGDLTKLSAQDLWEKLNVVNPKDQGTSYNTGDPTPPPIITVVVVYGTIPSIVTTGPGGPGSVEDWETLRKLEAFPPHQITLQVVGPDGSRVEGLAPHVVAAFLKRLFRNAGLKPES